MNGEEPRGGGAGCGVSAFEGASAGEGGTISEIEAAQGADEPIAPPMVTTSKGINTAKDSRLLTTPYDACALSNAKLKQ